MAFEYYGERISLSLADDSDEVWFNLRNGKVVFNGPIKNLFFYLHPKETEELIEAFLKLSEYLQRKKSKEDESA
jgi:hypothetical protein